MIKQCEVCKKPLAPNRKIPNLLYDPVTDKEIKIFLCKNCYLISRSFIGGTTHATNAGGQKTI